MVAKDKPAGPFCEDCGRPAVGRYDVFYIKRDGTTEPPVKARALCAEHVEGRSAAAHEQKLVEVGAA
jgi:hypothetical protein